MGMVRDIFSEKQPWVYGKLASFQLTDSTGQGFNTDRFKGHTWIANFIFTRCQGQCPMLTSKMQRIQTLFKDLELVSITVDPDHDTPENLLKFAKGRNLDTRNWHFLTGDKEKIKELMVKNFKLGFDGEPVFHTDRFVLVDAKGQIRGYYSLADKDQLRKLPKDITYLLDRQ